MAESRNDLAAASAGACGGSPDELCWQQRERGDGRGGRFVTSVIVDSKHEYVGTSGGPERLPSPERPDCAADAGGDFVRATTSEGNGVAFLLIGTGTRGVVLAAAALRHAGVRRVVLGGASQGGALAMSEAHRVRPRLAGVLSFGGELTLPGFDGRPGIKKWRGPLLALGSTHDSYFDSGDARKLRAVHPGPETVVMLPGDAHGIDLLDDPRQSRVRAAVDRFLAGVLS